MACWLEERRVLEVELGERITLDGLTGPVGCGRKELWQDDAGNPAGWMIAQRKGGHRHSIDDVLTAWYALEVSPPVTEHLDLGTGIGTVGLLTLWGLGADARLTCVEAQKVSHRLLLTNVRANGLGGRVEPMFGDLRDLALGKVFPLVTGSPPYFPPGAGVLPSDSQKAHARFELRGDVADYARAAVRHLAPGGWFVLCFPSPQNLRAIRGIEEAGLAVVRMREVIPRATLPPLFSLFACRHAAEAGEPMVVEPPLVVREEDGTRTAEMERVRQRFGY